MRLSEDGWSILFAFVVGAMTIAEHKEFVRAQNKHNLLPLHEQYVQNTRYNHEAKERDDYWFKSKMSVVVLLFLCYTAGKLAFPVALPVALQSRIDSGHRWAGGVKYRVGLLFLRICIRMCVQI